MSERPYEVRAALSRRDLLRYSLAGGVTVAAGGLLTACGSRRSSTAANPAAAGPPKSGGTLTIGMPSGGPTETLDPWAGVATNDYLRIINLYDTLFEFDDDLKVGPALAESGEVSADNSEWTIRLRDGVTFHDGSTLTVDDLIFNVNKWIDPNAYFYQLVGSQIDPKRIQRVDARTLKLGLNNPNARFDQDLAFLYGSIKSRNEKPNEGPIGTGPFKFSSFQPGSRSEFVRFENHWRPDPVYLDRLVVDSSFGDENARTNAFRAGQVDVLPFMSYALAKTITGSTGQHLLQSQSSAFANFYMRVDMAPFDDVRVRQAMRLLVNRQELIDVVYNGFGSVSNDVPGKFTEYYDETLVRERDVDQAKFLLKQAGKEGLAVTLQTAQFGDILAQSATLFEKQAKDAGVTVNIEQVDPSAYFDQSSYYGKMTFAQTLYYPAPSLPFIWVNSFLATNSSNETHWYESPNAELTKDLVRQARATADESKAAEIWKELQKQQFDEGGYINYGTMNYVDGVSDNVQGLTPSKYLFASGCNFRKAWLAT